MRTPREIEADTVVECDKAACGADASLTYRGGSMDVDEFVAMVWREAAQWMREQAADLAAGCGDEGVAFNIRTLPLEP